MEYDDLCERYLIVVHDHTTKEPHYKLLISAIPLSEESWRQLATRIDYAYRTLLEESLDYFDPFDVAISRLRTDVVWESFPNPYVIE